MSHPDIVQSALGDESVAARVSLGDDALFVTPTRTLLYRADSLLSDESVEEFPHGAERIDVSSGRRKASITLDYGLDGERSFTVPSKALDRALHPVLAGTLNASGVTDPGETVKETFRFSELTLVVTSDRLVKHVGSAVWDEDFDEYHFADVTDFAVEEGNVATTLVLTHDGRQERFKAPSDRSREVSERLTEALLTHHDADSLETLRERFTVDDEESPSATMSFGEGPTPLSATPSERADSAGDAAGGDGGSTDVGGVDSASATGTTDADSASATDTTDVDSVSPAPTDEAGSAEARGEGSSADASAPPGDETSATAAGESTGLDAIGTGDLLGPPGDEPADLAVTPDEAGDDELAALVAEVEALRETVEAQNERIARQEELLERLIAELRRRL
ncbi:hypothetical protein [Salinigranum sp.]|uniref:DUF7115 domain-containing protein n=1 Tax=Salinigranum sp. TaxID=1966351 RepID=UPI003568A490